MGGYILFQKNGSSSGIMRNNIKIINCQLLFENVNNFFLFIICFYFLSNYFFRANLMLNCISMSNFADNIFLANPIMFFLVSFLCLISEIYCFLPVTFVLLVICKFPKSIDFSVLLIVFNVKFHILIVFFVY